MTLDWFFSKFCVLHKPELMFIAEPWITIDNLPNNFLSRLNLKAFAVNDWNCLSPNLCGICLKDLSPDVISVSNQFIAISLLWDGHVIYVATIYACTTYILRRALWFDLANLQQSYSGPWLFIGDFNAVLGAHEKRGGNLPLDISCEEFKAWSDSCFLTHIETKGAQFTWNNGRGSIHETDLRLDRSICNEDWIDFWDSFSCCTLTRSQSNHHPIMVILNKGTTVVHSIFKFFKMWVQHPDCNRIVREVRKRHIEGCPMFVLSMKLSALKEELKVWNRNIFGNVEKQVEHALKQVDDIQIQIDTDGFSSDL